MWDMPFCGFGKVAIFPILQYFTEFDKSIMLHENWLCFAVNPLVDGTGAKPIYSVRQQQPLVSSCQLSYVLHYVLDSSVLALHSARMHVHVHVYTRVWLYVSVWVCVCVRAREHARVCAWESDITGYVCLCLCPWWGCRKFRSPVALIFCCP